MESAHITPAASTFLRLFPPLMSFGGAAFLSLFLMSWTFYDNSRDFVLMNRFETMYEPEYFDFVIVGGGSSGCLLANRLSSFANTSVLLLEAGGTPSFLHDVPAFTAFIPYHKQVDWMHQAIPQDNIGLALKNKRAGWPQGLGLGGTGNLHFLIQCRNSPKDYDNWANVTGDSSWTYEALLPHFRRHEKYEGFWMNNTDVHGFNGEITVSVPPFKGLSEYFVKAGEDVGINRVDLNGRFTEGIDVTHSPMKDGSKQTPYKVFLRPILNRPNLTVRKFSTVNKVLFEDSSKNIAIGVEYRRHGRTKKAFAKKEVILSAGTMQSAKVLMLSGIGNLEHLEGLHIPVRADLPVGDNVQDHLTTHIGPFFINEPLSFMADRDVSPRAIVQYLTSRTGALTSAGSHAIAFLTSSIAKARGEHQWPDIELTFAGAGIDSTYMEAASHFFNIDDKKLRQYYSQAADKDGFLIVPSIGRPRARGQIRLSDSDAKAPLSITPHYLQHQDDLSVMLEAINRSISIVESSPTMQKLGSQLYTVPFPGCEHLTFRSDAYWECYLRQLSVSDFHYVGSCAMGNDKRKSVVNSNLKVHDVDRLRVVDASVMPAVTVGNTHSATLVIAEKTAFEISKDWNLQDLNNNIV